MLGIVRKLRKRYNATRTSAFPIVANVMIHPTIIAFSRFEIGSFLNAFSDTMTTLDRVTLDTHAVELNY